MPGNYLLTLGFGLLTVAYLSFLLPKANTALPKTAICLVLAGSISNLYDRLVFAGVRDYLAFGWFGTINLADLMLTAGIALLLFYLIRTQTSGLRLEK